MSSMSYCRFENTYGDLEECLTALQDEGGIEGIEEDTNDREKPYIKKLIALCRDIAEEYGEYNEFD